MDTNIQSPNYALWCSKNHNAKLLYTKGNPTFSYIDPQVNNKNVPTQNKIQ